MFNILFFYKPKKLVTRLLKIKSRNVNSKINPIKWISAHFSKTVTKNKNTIEIRILIVPSHYPCECSLKKHNLFIFIIAQEIWQ